MKFIKSNLKLIIGFIVGIILASGITVYAYSYFASDVGYTTNKNGQVQTVADALNDLYGKINNSQTVSGTGVIDNRIATDNGMPLISSGASTNFMILILSSSNPTFIIYDSSIDSTHFWQGYQYTNSVNKYALNGTFRRDGDILYSTNWGSSRVGQTYYYMTWD